jgi:hypothetical protein
MTVTGHLGTGNFKNTHCKKNLNNLHDREQFKPNFLFVQGVQQFYGMLRLISKFHFNQDFGGQRYFLSKQFFTKKCYIPS